MNVCKILALSKGQYSSTQNYDVLDFVQEGPAIYQSKQPNNQGHAVTDTDWWKLHYDLSVAIAAATNVNSPETKNGAEIARIMCIGTDGQPKSITPAELVDYVLNNSLNYDVIARNKPSNT